MSKDEIIETEIGILKSASDLTPMDKGECKKVMDAWLKSQVESITDNEIELKLLKDITYKRYGDRAKEAYYFGAKWFKQTLLNKYNN